MPCVSSAQVPEDAVPLTLRRGPYVMSGSMWTKFRNKFPHVSFDEFWNYKIQKYEERNSSAKQFFVNFSRNRFEHQFELLGRRLEREERRFERLERGITNPLISGNLTPKDEPLDAEELEYMYKIAG